MSARNTFSCRLRPETRRERLITLDGKELNASYLNTEILAVRNYIQFTKKAFKKGILIDESIKHYAKSEIIMAEKMLVDLLKLTSEFKNYDGQEIDQKLALADECFHISLKEIENEKDWLLRAIIGIKFSVEISTLVGQRTENEKVESLIVKILKSQLQSRSKLVELFNRKFECQ